jgi:arginine-tRNA-protein transferase
LTLDEFDQCLASGIRRSGVFLYHTACDQCNACEPSRIDVHKFVWRDSFHRVLKRGDQCLKIQAANPSLDDERLMVFNLHRTQRGLGDADSQYRPEDYENFLVDTCLSQTVELSFWLGEKLVAISIVDCGLISLSAVYTYFDPLHSKLSLGTYSILKQIEFARDTGRQYAYLGMYVSENRHLSYKARFTPQERWVVDKWVAFE